MHTDRARVLCPCVCIHDLSHILISPRSYANAEEFVGAVLDLTSEILADIDKAYKARTAAVRDVVLLGAALELGCLTSYLADKWKHLITVMNSLMSSSALITAT